MHKHHVIFRSQGGLDIDINLKDLGHEDHLGNDSPHRNRDIDLQYKAELQLELEQIFCKEEYSLDEIAKKLNKSKKYIEKKFKRVPHLFWVFKREDIIKRLMGGKLYV